ncbi:MAG: squalene/phytoene synthase family protein [Planctomycetes bacterium]|nr:squalene/phytoene synthase family protein [Planctomycetota bacterium]
MRATLAEERLAASYAACRERTRAASSSFAAGIRLLPRDRRGALEALYAFFRLADDIADGDAPGRRLEECRALAEGRLPDDPLAPALQDVRERFAVRLEDLLAVVEGCEQDARQTRYATWGELEAYCHRVASSVGLACLEVFGYSAPRARDHAAELGLGMQLVNIVRDVGEDARRGRIYLPAAELERHGAREADCLAGRTSGELAACLASVARRARGHLGAAGPLLECIEPESAACPAALQAAYRRLLRRMAGDGFRVLERRYRLSAADRLSVLARALRARRRARAR